MDRVGQPGRCPHREVGIRETRMGSSRSVATRQVAMSGLRNRLETKHCECSPADYSHHQGRDPAQLGGQVPRSALASIRGVSEASAAKFQMGASTITSVIGTPGNGPRSQGHGSLGRKQPGRRSARRVCVYGVRTVSGARCPRPIHIPHRSSDGGDQ